MKVIALFHYVFHPKSDETVEESVRICSSPEDAERVALADVGERPHVVDHDPENGLVLVETNDGRDIWQAHELSSEGWTYLF